jgi:hypothetical protein
LTSCTVVPLPAAIRLFRLPSMITGFSRSLTVIEQIIASILPIMPLSISVSFSWFPSPGIIESSSPSDPILLICRS